MTPDDTERLRQDAGHIIAEAQRVEDAASPAEEPARDPLMVHVAWRIQREMRRRRMSTRGLAVRAGLDDRTVRRVLDARNTGLSKLAAIASALQLPLASVIVSSPAETAADPPHRVA